MSVLLALLAEVAVHLVVIVVVRLLDLGYLGRLWMVRRFVVRLVVCVLLSLSMCGTIRS